MTDEALLAEIQTMANDDNWEVRERAADRIKEVNDTQFEEYLSIWKEWVKDQNPFLRRAVEVGLLRINRRHYDAAFDLLIPLLYDDHPYVRKNCGPFALSAVAYRNPPESFTRFDRLLQDPNANLRWNIAMCLGVMFGMRHPHESVPRLERLARDERRFVWRAAASSLVKLLRRFPQYKDEVYSWPGVDHVLAVVKKYVDWQND